MENADTLSFMMRLPPDIRAVLSGIMHEVTFKTGEQIFTQDELHSDFYIVVTGRIKIVFTGDDGHEVTLCMPQSGETFCVASVLDGGPQLGTAYAMTDVRLLSAQPNEFNALCKKYPQLLSLAQQYCFEELRQIIKRLETATFHSVEMRLAGVLLGKDFSGLTNHSSIGELHITHQELADLIGTSRETVSRVLEIWRQKGLVVLKRGYIIINRRDELERQALK
ncbi:MAG: Crp/Fnr family transcriptional regulator [Chloroflexi bacterium]|nr:Crp/Fnr family transcriptional regulator [Chloroflexota bacterium]